MTYSFPTLETAKTYLTSNGWTAKGDYFSKPTVRGDNAAIPAVAIVRIMHNHVEPRYNKPDFFTVEFI